MQTPIQQPENYPCCGIFSHRDCELATICACPTCPNRGPICYLCPFIKPHSEHSPLDIVPMKLINRGKSTKARHSFLMELENELNSKQEAHLRQIQKVRNEVLDVLYRYEEKVNKEFGVLKNEILVEEDDLLEKFERKTFKDRKDFQKSSELLLQRLKKENTGNSSGPIKWIYEENIVEYTHLFTNTRSYLQSLQFQYKQTKEHLTSLITELFKFPIQEITVDDYLTQVLFKKTAGIKDSFLSSSKYSSFGSEIQSNVSSSSNFEMARSNTPSARSPMAVDYSGEDTKKHRTRPFTFGRKQDMESDGVEVDSILQESLNESKEVSKNEKREREHSKKKMGGIIKNIQNVGKILRSSRKHEENSEKSKIRKNDAKTPEKVGKKGDTKPSNDKHNKSKHNDSDSDFGMTMMESETRFIPIKEKEKAQTQRILKKPEEKFDALSFYSKINDIAIEGFGFYCPLPCDGTRLDLEYRLYEGTEKEGKEVMRDEVRFDCDTNAVKEKAVVERILLKEPITLKKKKWYTLVLIYSNDMKLAYEGGKWKDIGPFVFLGVEKKQVKEWLGMKTIEAEKMYTSQFPYLIYSQL